MAVTTPHNPRKHGGLTLKPAISRIRWLRSLLGGIVVIVLSLIATTLAVTGYAFYLAFQARGAPDQEMISRFAQGVAPWLSSILEIVFTFAVAAFVVRRTREAPVLQGLSVGLFAGLFGIVTAVPFGGGLSPLTLGILLLVVAAGWLAGVVTGPR